MASPTLTSVVGGAKGTAAVKVSNIGGVASKGLMGVSLFLSADKNLDANDTPLATVSKKLSLKFQGSKALKLKFVYPSTLPDGSYFLIGQVDRAGVFAEQSETNNVGASATPVVVTKPFADLGVTPLVGAAPGTTLTPGKKSVVSFTLNNTGNVPSASAVDVQVLAVPVSTTQTTVPLTTIRVSAKVKAQKTKTIKLKFAVPPTLPPGDYTLRVVVDPQGLLADPQAVNNTFDLPGTVTVI